MSVMEGSDEGRELGRVEGEGGALGVTSRDDQIECVRK